MDDCGAGASPTGGCGGAGGERTTKLSVTLREAYRRRAHTLLGLDGELSPPLSSSPPHPCGGATLQGPDSPGWITSRTPRGEGERAVGKGGASEGGAQWRPSSPPVESRMLQMVGQRGEPHVRVSVAYRFEADM